MNEFIFQFNADHEIKEDSGFYRNYPTLSDKMHCVLFVVRADDLDEQRVGANDLDKQTYVSVLHSMRQYLQNRSKCLFLLYEDIQTTSCKYIIIYKGNQTIQ